MEKIVFLENNVGRYLWKLRSQIEKIKNINTQKINIVKIFRLDFRLIVAAR